MMSERTDDTKRLAQTAFWAILAGGKPPTVDLVMDWLVTNNHARRNRNAIAEQLKTCWVEVGRKASMDRNIPGLPQETIELVIGLRDHLYGICKRDFLEDEKQLRESAAREVAQAGERATALEAKLAVERETVRLQEDRITTLQSELSTSNESRVALQEALTEMRVAAESAQHRANTATAECDSLARQLVESAKAHREALQREEVRYQDLQRTLMQQLDDERTRSSKLGRQVESLETRLQQCRDELQAAVRTHSAEHSHLSAELGEARGRAEALQMQALERQVVMDRQIVQYSELSEAYRELKAHSEATEKELKRLKAKQVTHGARKKQ